MGINWKQKYLELVDAIEVGEGIEGDRWTTKWTDEERKIIEEELEKWRNEKN